MSEIVCNVCGDAVQCYDPEDLGLGCKKAPCPGHYCLERDLEDPRFIPPVTDTLTTLLAWAESHEGTWPVALRDLLAEHKKLKTERDQLRVDVEHERLRLVACGVAATQNTAKTIADRIGKDTPCWSGSYGDVCAAVDREMVLRDELAEMKRTLENTEKLVDMTAKISIDESARECIGDAISERDQLRAELDSANERAEKAWVALIAASNADTDRLKSDLAAAQKDARDWQNLHTKVECELGCACADLVTAKERISDLETWLY